MAEVSIILPCREETTQVNLGMTVLERTVQDIYEKATGAFEVIVAFDGPPFIPLPPRENLTIISREWRGTRPTINEAVDIARGKYILKADAHCMFDKGFDEKLQVGMQDNWVVTPRLYILDAEKWAWQDDRFYDYFFLPCPFTYPRGFMFQAGGHWKDRTRDRLDILLDENMKLHGSAFFMTKYFFTYCLGGLSVNSGAGTWNGEDIEITMKTWLGPWGGKLMANKSTWYAHMHRGGQRPREYGFSYHDAYESARWTAQYWMANKWSESSHDIQWLIEKFWPLPGWPENWRELHKNWLEKQ